MGSLRHKLLTLSMRHVFIFSKTYKEGKLDMGGEKAVAGVFEALYRERIA